MIEWMEYTYKFIVAMILSIGMIAAFLGTMSLVAYFFIDLLPKLIIKMWEECIPERFKKMWIIMSVICSLILFVSYIAIGIAYVGREL